MFVDDFHAKIQRKSKRALLNISSSLQRTFDAPARALSRMHLLYTFLSHRLHEAAQRDEPAARTVFTIFGGRDGNDENFALHGTRHEGAWSPAQSSSSAQQLHCTQTHKTCTCNMHTTSTTLHSSAYHVARR